MTNIAVPSIRTWTEWKSVGDVHRCYFCHPELYPPMPRGCTMCSCCGVLIVTGVTDDPMNEAMELCPTCEDWIKKEDEKEVRSDGRDDS